MPRSDYYQAVHDAFLKWAHVQKMDAAYDEAAEEFRDERVQSAFNAFSAGFGYGWSWD